MSLEFKVVDCTCEVYGVWSNHNYIGMVVLDPKGKFWAATWNMVPFPGDDRYQYVSREVAAEELLRRYKKMS